MKKKFILGLLLIMAMAVCGAFLIDVPQHVFATEEEASSTYYVEDEAGKFYGKGYYEVGDLAELRAEMNDGYWFVCLRCHCPRPWQRDPCGQSAGGRCGSHLCTGQGGKQ